MSKALLHFLNRELSWLGCVAGADGDSCCDAPKGMVHMLNRGLSRGFGAWVEMAVERAEFMQKLRKGLSRMVNRKLAVGFSGWASVAHGNAAMNKGLLHMLNRELSRGLRCWHAYWERFWRSASRCARALVIC